MNGLLLVRSVGRATLSLTLVNRSFHTDFVHMHDVVLFCTNFVQILSDIGVPSEAFICMFLFMHCKLSYSSVYNLYISF